MLNTQQKSLITNSQDNKQWSSQNFQDWNRESTPLKPRGKEAKFPNKPLDKFSGTEKDNVYIQLEVEGDPVPNFEFYKVRPEREIIITATTEKWKTVGQTSH